MERSRLLEREIVQDAGGRVFAADQADWHTDSRVRAGTVAVISVGMFGSGGGWRSGPTNYALQLTVGGINRKPGIVIDEIEPREYLNLTVTFDHDVVDGAPAARFVHRLKELVEDAHGTETESEA